MNTLVHRARGKHGLFSARRLSLHHCHRILTVSIVAASSLIVPLVAVFKPAWPNEIKQAQRAEPPKCDQSQFRVILDVGHTAEAQGAISARNVREYHFNVRLAAHIERSLIEEGFNKTVLLVTGGPARPSLFDRVARANRFSTNLFISIHHDSVPDRLLESWDVEGKESHFSDRFRGHSIFISYQNPHLNGSLLFGRLLGNELKDRGLQYARQYTQAIMGRHQHKLIDSDAGIYRYDRLIVLKETKMPAVLFEAGSNRDEELQMNTPERLDMIGASVRAAVRMFCILRSLQ